MCRAAAVLVDAHGGVPHSTPFGLVELENKYWRSSCDTPVRAPPPNSISSPASNDEQQEAHQNEQ